MDNKLAGVLILTAFASGYGLCLYQAPLELPALAVTTNTLVVAQASSSAPEEAALADVEFPEPSASSSSNSAKAFTQTSSAPSTVQPPPASASAQASAASSSAPAANQTSDDELEQLVPKPFTSSFKKASPELKSKYKDFVDTTKNRPDDWDIRMQGLLRDFIMSRPMAADIIIDSLICNANLCEVRLLENKKFLLLGLFGDLMQQPWIANQVKGTVDFNPDNSNACYILLMRNTPPGQ